MMFMNLIWAWGHPEVYILVLPAFGIYSEVISTFSASRCSATGRWSRRRWRSAILAFMVWLHHFFTMGAGADVNAIFGIATMIIAVPTGVKVFNWLFTMYGGRITYSAAMLWSIGFMITFVVGGMTGVLLAVPPADFVLHNSLFLVAHFHTSSSAACCSAGSLAITTGFRRPSASAARRAGQGRLLVLDHRLLPGLHAALRAGAAGHDAPHAALRCSPPGGHGC